MEGRTRSRRISPGSSQYIGARYLSSSHHWRAASSSWTRLSGPFRRGPSGSEGASNSSRWTCKEKYSGLGADGIPDSVWKTGGGMAIDA
eukprot:2130016-Pyramimonas_sp.AAC.1